MLTCVAESGTVCLNYYFFGHSVEQVVPSGPFTVRVSFKCYDNSEMYCAAIPGDVCDGRKHGAERIVGRHAGVRS